MSDASTNAIRDSLIRSSPESEGQIRTRDQVVEKWCAEHGVAKDEIGVEQLLEIRALPEWQNAS
ncbi:MAG TPA: hypothetical protein QF549_00270 [Candidatus Saccharimonadaceae bacterium]|nr:hypothetical protein [Candidatus Saccharimonadaceae bacterium]|tara:strand:+ start:932 stop:1123 length:192 start_codon:yes stop_codon:yes gene_type:complete